jgi:hypothetical protein
MIFIIALLLLFTPLDMCGSGTEGLDIDSYITDVDESIVSSLPEICITLADDPFIIEHSLKRQHFLRELGRIEGLGRSNQNMVSLMQTISELASIDAAVCEHVCANPNLRELDGFLEYLQNCCTLKNFCEIPSFEPFRNFLLLVVRLYTKDVQGVLEAQDFELLYAEYCLLKSAANRSCSNKIVLTAFETTYRAFIGGSKDKSDFFKDMTARYYDLILSLDNSLKGKVKKVTELIQVDYFSKIFTMTCAPPLLKWFFNALQQHAASLSGKSSSIQQHTGQTAQSLSVDEMAALLGDLSIVTSDQGVPAKKKKSQGSAKKAPLSSSTAGKLPQVALPAPQELVPMDGALIVRVGMHQLYQRLCNYSSSFDADFITFQRAHNNRVVIEQDGLIHDRANHSQIILNTGKGENASMPNWITNGQFGYASRIGMEGKDDYRHMFPFVIDKKFLKYGTYSLRESDSGVLQPHVEIVAQILYFDEETGTKPVSTLNCVLEYTFDEVTHTCYHRFARTQ